MVIMFYCFLMYDVTWCMCYGDYRLYFGGGSYSSVYVAPPMFVSPLVLAVYIPVVFFIFLSFYILYSYFLVHITPGFAFSQLCEGGVHMYFIIYSYMCILKYVYLI